MLFLGTLSRPERRLLARLWKVGSVEVDSARPLPPLGHAPQGWLARLVNLELIFLDAQGRGYVNGRVYRPAVLVWRLTLGFVTACILVFGVYLTWGSA